MCYDNSCETHKSNKDRSEYYLKALKLQTKMCTTQVWDSALLIVEKAQVSVTLEINSEKEYEIVELSNTEEDKLFKNQKNKMLIHSNSTREKLSLYKKYSEE